MEKETFQENSVEELCDTIVEKDKQIVILRGENVTLEKQINYFRASMMNLTAEVDKVKREMQRQTGVLEINLKGLANCLLQRKEMCATQKEIIRRQEKTIENLTHELVALREKKQEEK